MGRVTAVNVGTPRELTVGERTFTTGIFKHPVDGPRRLADDHVTGDVQANTVDHGGPDKAVYAYASEETAWWATRLGRDDLGPGTWGENLTLEGVTVSEAVLGTRWQVGGAVVRVTQPRIPCFKLAAKMGDPRFATTFAQGRRPGAYLAINTPGAVAAGDAVEVLAVPDHGVTVADISAAYHRLDDETADARRHRLEHLLTIPDLPAAARGWITRELAAT